MQMNASKPRMYKVLSPVEKKDGSTFWMRVGTAFPAKDATSINLYLDAMPLNKNNMLHIREMDEEDLERVESRRAQRRTGADPVTATGGDDLPF
jgi:hypothetical protein